MCTNILPYSKKKIMWPLVEVQGRWLYRKKNIKQEFQSYFRHDHNLHTRDKTWSLRSSPGGKMFLLPNWLPLKGSDRLQCSSFPSRCQTDTPLRHTARLKCLRGEDSPESLTAGKATSSRDVIEKQNRAECRVEQRLMTLFKEDTHRRNKVNTEAWARTNRVAVVMVWTRRAEAKERERM